MQLETLGISKATLFPEIEQVKELGITPASASQTISGLYLKKLIARTGSGRSVRWKAVSAVKEKFTNEHS